MTFKNPQILFLLPLVIFGVYFFIRRQLGASFRFSSIKLLQGLSKGWKIPFRQNLYLVRLVVLGLFILALAGPRKVLEEAQYKTDGIDIILAIDSSGSMAAEDFEIDGKRANRLEVVRRVVADFIKGRENDRIGLVSFAKFAYTVCPLTLDQDWLITNLDRIQLGVIEDGTAVGSAVASSAARLKDSKAKTKIVILLTDGVSNTGEIDPVSAARIAKALDIRVYTIGAGTKGLVPFPLKDLWGRTMYQNVNIDLDERTLKEIANITGGKYFWAMDTQALKAIYKEIDRMEKVEIQQTGYREYEQLFWIFLVPGLILLLMEILLSRTLLLKVP